MCAAFPPVFDGLSLCFRFLPRRSGLQLHELQIIMSGLQNWCVVQQPYARIMHEAVAAYGLRSTAQQHRLALRSSSWTASWSKPEARSR